VSRADPYSDTTAGSRIDRLALRIARRSPAPVTAPPPALGDDGQLSRRKVLTRALGASALVMLPLRLANPTAAQADGYCAAQCLNDANTAYNTRLTKCFVSAFGTDIPDQKAFATYVAAKIRSGGLGALVLANEIASADACGVGDQIHYYHDAGQCGGPNCGDPKKYPRPGCETCAEFCCFCPSGVVAAGCLPNGDTSSCDRTCAACLQAKAGGFPVRAGVESRTALEVDTGWVRNTSLTFRETASSVSSCRIRCLAAASSNA
jgi:hypothetical protein